jgi:hypothetical protein
VPGVIFTIWHSNPRCWYVFDRDSKHHRQFDEGLIVGRNPRWPAQDALLYSAGNGAMQAVATGVYGLVPRIISFKRPIVVIGYRHSRRRSYYNLVGGRFTSPN